MGNDLQMPAGRAITDNPQQIGQSGLQGQSATLLQSASSLTASGINQIDQRSAGIALSPAASASTTTSTPASNHTQVGWAYGGLALIVVILIGGIVYGLLRHE